MDQAAPRTGQIGASGAGTIGPLVVLTCVTAVWGSTFFMVKDLVATIPALDFLGVRFVIAGAAIGFVRFRQLRRASSLVWQRGILLGVLFAAAQLAQTVGLQHTAASVSGFVTGMYVVLTPIVLWVLFRRSVPRSTWVAIACSVAGMAVLSLRGTAFGPGEALTLLGALFYAVHIVFLGRWATRASVADLGSIQVMTVGVVCIIGALPGGIELPQAPTQWAQMLYMALLASAGAIIAQTWAQARVAPTTAAVLMTTEPVFTALFSVLFGGESVGPHMLIGGALILMAMFAVELLPKRRGVAATEI